MPRFLSLSETKLHAVLDSLALLGGSARIESLEAALNPSVPRRTLQRWLKTLVVTGRLQKTGRGPSTLYVLSPTKRESTASTLREEEACIPLSIPSQEILDYVSRPLS